MYLFIINLINKAISFREDHLLKYQYYFYLLNIIHTKYRKNKILKYLINFNI